MADDPNSSPSATPAEPSHAQLSIPPLSYPSDGNYPVTFAFGAIPSIGDILEKYKTWGLAGHNGLDFGLPQGTHVFACDDGTVLQAGENGAYGISVTLTHLWGTSIYGHLQTAIIAVSDHVTKNQVIGFSGQTGNAYGAHLHFGIRPANPDFNNGYLGYIDPTPYVSAEVIQSVQSPVPQADTVPPVSPSTPSVQLNNQAKKYKHTLHLQRIMGYARQKQNITNKQVRDLLHVSHSTATGYLSELVHRGMMKTEGKGKRTSYIL